MADKSERIHWLTEEWLTRLSAAVELMTEARPALMRGSQMAAGGADVPSGALWLSISLDLGLGSAILIGAAAESWLAIGKAALTAAGVDKVSPEDAKSTYLEILTQATSGLAQALSVKLGKPVATLPAKEAPLSDPAFGETLAVTPIEISLRESPLGKLFLGLTRGLEAALATPDAAPEEMAVQRPQPERSRTFDLLMEVELPVSVSFGRAQLPLRDVLKLTSGSIVELNRTISDPVEIIVNNCVIARGEVVVVEGNYGVRIQHVISREERLRTLK